MLRPYFILILVFFSNLCFSQDTVRLKQSNYTSIYSKSKKYPVLVEFWVTKSMVDCKTPLKRKDAFKPDPLLPNETDNMKDFVNSGTDRGHMMPAADNLCQTPQIQDECFYFTNIAAQFHSLNAGDWKSLEVHIRETAKSKDSIMVWCGNFGELKKIGRVTVPKYCWKVFFIKKENLWSAFLFENSPSKPDGFKNNEVSPEEITKLTGFKFR